MGDQITQIYNQALQPVIAALTLQLLFYGIYVSLSWTYVSLLVRQKDAEKFKHLFYPISTLTLFLLATAGVIMSTFDLGNLIQLLLVNMVGMDPTAREITFVKTRTAIGVVYTLANFVGDIILVYRCYYVWNGKWLAVIAPSILSVINTIMAFLSTAEIQVGSTEEFATGGQSSQVSAGDSLLYAFLAINVFNNVLLTALIAGRLWYLNRASAKLFGITATSDKRYNAIISMFLESGSLYPIALIICLAIQVHGSPATMDPILLQIVGIAPMLILVRTTLGISIEHAPRREDVDTELENSNLPMQTMEIKHSSRLASPAASIIGSEPVTHSNSTSDYHPSPVRDSRTITTSKYNSGDSRLASWNPHSQQSSSGNGTSMESDRWNQDPFNDPSTPRSTTSDRLIPLRLHE